MAEAAVVDCDDMRVGLQGQVAVGISSPALGDVAGVAVDFFAAALLVVVCLMGFWRAGKRKLTIDYHPSRWISRRQYLERQRFGEVRDGPMGSLSFTQGFGVAQIGVYGQDMPCIQRFTIGRGDCERRDLAFGESKLFRIVDIMPEERVDLMGVQSTGMNGQLRLAPMTGCGKMQGKNTISAGMG